MINTHTKKYFSPTFFTLSKFGNRCSRCSHLNLFCSTAFVDVRPAKFQAICLESFSIKIEIGFFFLLLMMMIMRRMGMLLVVVVVGSVVTRNDPCSRLLFNSLEVPAKFHYVSYLKTDKYKRVISHPGLLLSHNKMDQFLLCI